jgi:hypothetical protein
LSFWPASTAASASAIAPAIVDAGLAAWPDAGAVLAQADNNAIQVRGTAASGIRRSKVIWLSRVEIRRHYW